MGFCFFMISKVMYRLFLTRITTVAQSIDLWPYGCWFESKIGRSLWVYLHSFCIVCRTYLSNETWLIWKKKKMIEIWRKWWFILSVQSFISKMAYLELQTYSRPDKQTDRQKTDKMHDFENEWYKFCRKWWLIPPLSFS